jgi:hypothetical protein
VSTISVDCLYDDWGLSYAVIELGTIIHVSANDDGGLCTSCAALLYMLPHCSSDLCIGNSCVQQYIDRQI